MQNGATRPPAAASKQQPGERAAGEKKQRAVLFKARHGLLVAFFLLITLFHALAIYLFCSGFLLSRLVLPDRSQCAAPPVALSNAYEPGSIDKGCWHPKSFDKAVIILIDALRYDFTVPFRARADDPSPHFFHNAMPFLHETAREHPERAFLRPFIADPPTTTLQRLKGLTTGTLPTFIEAGSNFAGTAIDEDNLVEQLFLGGKKVVHLGDDTWHALFPGYFEPNLTKAYDSFRVWDLHTLDNGVNEHIFPLLQSGMRDRWDVIIGHYLGVDHAGHRYGPDHQEMADKLRQMDGVIRNVAETLEDDTLLVVMGDHGMDVKGDHGGESDDEVQAALWMYSKKGIFGRSDPAFREPPATAKERPVGQIDLVPTLALLLGIPIPFNNLGGPIEEAFIGAAGNNHKNLADVRRLTSAQIHDYQKEYMKARALDESLASPVEARWTKANEAWQGVQTSMISTGSAWKGVHEAFNAYQDENLQVYRSLWARFDLVSMGMGIVALALTLAVLVVYAFAIQGDRAALTPALLLWGTVGTIGGCIIGGALSSIFDISFLQLSAFGAALGGTLASLFALLPARALLRFPYPRTLWGWLCTLVTLMLCIGFAANSFTIWEDEQLLFFLTTFGVLMLGSSLGLSNTTDRNLGVMHCLSFLVATRLSSFSRLCREEQMPNCRSSYYASSKSSTSAGWQLAIPFIVAVILPVAIRDFYTRTRNYQGSAVVWIGIALRMGLFLTAVYWVIDAADDGNWYPGISNETLKTTRIYIAQVVLALAGAGGYATYIWASPFLLVKTEEATATTSAPPTSTSKPIDSSTPNAPILTTINAAPPPSSQQPRPKLLILGYSNTHGTRYFLLPTVWVLALLLVQKPMGQGALALCTVSILSLLEILDSNNLHTSPLGPIVLALLGSFHFFKTGHQAAAATIQWETAFLTTRQISYPISPLIVTLNAFGPFILTALAVPAVALWKIPPRDPRALGRVAGALAVHFCFFAAIALATVVEAAWLRRHLMLYRVFMPRMLLGVGALLIVEVVGTLAALGGVRWSMGSVGEVFGWPEEDVEEGQKSA